jgi:hypothetical protein
LGLIGFKRGGEDGVEGIHTHAALETAGGFLAQQALIFTFFTRSSVDWCR